MASKLAYLVGGFLNILLLPILARAQETCANPKPYIDYPKSGQTITSGILTPKVYSKPFDPDYAGPCAVLVERTTFRIQNGGYVQDGLSFDLTNAPIGTFQLTAFQVFASGQTGQKTISFTLMDTTPPEITKLTPSNGAEIKGVTEIAVEAFDLRGIAGVKFYLTDTTKTTTADATFLGEDKTFPFGFAFDSRQYPDRKVRIMVLAEDNSNWKNKRLQYADYLINNDNKAPTIFFYDRTPRVVSGIVRLQVYFHDPESFSIAQFYVDGARVAAFTDSLVRWFDLDTTKYPDGRHLITGIATDTSNLSSEQTIELEFFNHADTQPPSVELVSHHQGQVISGITEFTAVASDDKGVDRLEFIFGGRPLGVDLTPPFTAKLNTSQFSNAVHDLVINAFDKSNLKSSITVYLAVQNDPSQNTTSLEITSPKDGAAVAGLAEISVLALDSSNLETLEISINSELYAASGAPPYIFIIDTKKYEDGTYLVKAAAKDKNGGILEDEISLQFNNSDRRIAKPNETVGKGYRDNFRHTASLLNNQVSGLSFSGNAAPSESFENSLKTFAGLLKAHRKELREDQSMSQVSKLSKKAVKKAKRLMKSGEGDFKKKKRDLLKLLRKLNKALKKI